MKTTKTCFALLLLLQALGEAAGAQSITEIIDVSAFQTDDLIGPEVIAVDASGNAYVTGTVRDFGVGHSRVFKISAAGLISEITDRLDDPRGMVVDPSGILYVADQVRDSVVRITPRLPFSPRIRTILDSSGDGASALVNPRGLALDAAGNVFVAGSFSDNVFRIAPDGTIAEILDATGDGTHVLRRPWGLAVDAAGNVFVTGALSDNVFRIAPDGTITQILDAAGDGASALSEPRGVAVDASGNVYVAGFLSSNAFKVSPAGAVTEILDATGDGTHPLAGASAVAAEPAGTVYVAGFDSDNVFAVNGAGTITEILDATGDGDHPLDGASGLAVEPSGNLYVTGWYSDNAFRITPPGPVLAESVGLIVPGFEIDLDDPDGPTTLFAIRNTTGAPVSGVIDYVDANPFETLRSHAFTVDPETTLTRNAREDLLGLETEDGVARGMIVITELGAAGAAAPQAPSLEGDYFRLDSGNDFASGDRMARPADFCLRQEVRFVDFGTGSRLRILLARPRGDYASFTYAAYDERGVLLAEGAYFTSSFLVELDAADLAAGAGFGTVRFNFESSAGGYVSAQHSAFGRFSVELDAACGDRGPGVSIAEIIGNAATETDPLLSPRSIAVDAKGNVYVTGFGTDNVFKITPRGHVSEIIDGSGDGASRLDSPCAVAVDRSGNVYVTGCNSDNAFKIAVDGTITEIIDGSGSDGGSILRYPFGVAVDPSGNVYVAGTFSDNVFKVEPDGTIVRIINGTGYGAGVLDYPRGLAADGAGNVYVTGVSSDNAFRITPGGTITEIIDRDGDGDGPGGELRGPQGLAVDGSGNVYVAGAFTDNVFKVTPDGAITEILDYTGDGASVLDYPRGLAVDGTGHVYVTASYSENAFRIEPDGTVTEILDGTGDGVHELVGSDAMAVSVSGIAYVTGYLSHNAFRIAPPDSLDRAAGLIVPGFEAAADGPGGPTTLFAVRNTTGGPVAGVIEYFGLGTTEPLRTDAFSLGPQETLTRDVGDDLSDLEIEDGVARGMIVVTELGDTTAASLAGDYFRVDPGNDFAGGDHLVRPADFCFRQEVRFVDFGRSSRLRVLVNRPRGDEVPSFSYTVYDEAGNLVAAGEELAAGFLSVLDVAELAAGERFGTVRFDFEPSAGGWVSAEHSAFGRFSVEVDAACVDDR